MTSGSLNLSFIYSLEQHISHIMNRDITLYKHLILFRVPYAANLRIRPLQLFLSTYGIWSGGLIILNSIRIWVKSSCCNKIKTILTRSKFFSRLENLLVIRRAVILGIHKKLSLRPLANALQTNSVKQRKQICSVGQSSKPLTFFIGHRWGWTQEVFRTANKGQVRVFELPSNIWTTSNYTRLFLSHCATLKKSLSRMKW